MTFQDYDIETTFFTIPYEVTWILIAIDHVTHADTTLSTTATSVVYGIGAFLILVVFYVGGIAVKHRHR